MREDIRKEFIDRFDLAEFTVDKEERTTSFTGVMLQGYEDYEDFLRLHRNKVNLSNSPLLYATFNLEKSTWSNKNSYGGLLLSFMQADFNTINGFTAFMHKWGLSGLLDINPDFDSPRLEERSYSTQEVMKIKNEFFVGTHEALISAQRDFRNVIDYCLDVSERPYLEPLDFLQRYYIGSELNVIPNLEAYCGNHRTIYKATNDTDIIKISSGLPASEFAKNVAEAKIRMIPSVRSLDIRTFVYHEFFTIINDLLLKKCNNCQSYFVVKTKTNEIYCESCRNISYSTKVKVDPLRAAYNTAYKTRHREKQRRLKLQPDNQAENTLWEKRLNLWVDYAKGNLKAAQNGDITQDEFLEYLKKKLEDI